MDSFYGEPDPRRKDSLAGQVLTWGILSLAFAGSGCLALLGFIFSFTAKRKANEYLRTFGALEGRARVGHILGRVGFGVGLGMTIFWGVYVTIIVFVAMLSLM